MNTNDYGTDDLHNARLLGAHHVRRGWGDIRLYQAWYLSLKRRDTRFLQIYTLRGEPGRTDLGMTKFVDVVQDSIGVNAATLEVFQAPIRRLAESLAELGNEIVQNTTPAINTFADAFDETGSLHDFAGIMIAVERINLRHNLQRARIPAPVACWLARRWPAWALPVVAWMRLQKQMAHEGEILLRWWHRLGALFANKERDEHHHTRRSLENDAREYRSPAPAPD